MKTTLEIADPLLREAKRLAVRDRTTLRALVEEGLQTVVVERTKPKKSRGWKIKPFRGEGLTDEFKDASWSKIRSAAYGLPNCE